jgi:tRNA (adenine22-N1)-methyltransferase
VTSLASVAAPPLTVPRLPPRLAALGDLLPQGSVADIGSGHGALAAWLALSGRRVVAIEASPAALAELRANLAAWGVDAAVDCRLGRGFEPLRPGEVAGAAIAGLGGNTLVAIARSAPAAQVGWLVLQCVQRVEALREWIEGPAALAGWRVIREQVVRERGRAYPTWVLSVGGDAEQP